MPEQHNDYDDIDLTQFLPEEVKLVESVAKPVAEPVSEPIAEPIKEDAPEPEYQTMPESMMQEIILPAPPPPPEIEDSKIAVSEEKPALIPENGEHLTLKEVLAKNYPQSEAKPKPKKGKAVLIGILSCLMFSIVALGGSIVAAENGYWPAFSSVYRQTNLPLLWKGTNQKVELAALRSYNQLNQKKSYKVSTTSSLKAESLNNTTSVSTSTPSPQELWKIATNTVDGLKSSLGVALVKKFALTDTVYGLSYENEAPYSVSDQNKQYNFDSYLPITINAFSETKADDFNNIQEDIQIDASDLVKKVPTVADYLVTRTGKVNASGVLIDSEDTIYFKHNLEAIKSDEDKALGDNAWFSYTGAKELTSDIEKDVDDSNLTPENYKDNALYKQNEPMIRAFLARIEDLGIERVDGEAYAHYQGKDIVLEDLLKEVDPNSDALKDTSGYKILVNLDLLVNPRTAELYKLNLQFVINMTSENVKLTSDTTVRNYQNSKVNKLVPPNKNNVTPFKKPSSIYDLYNVN